MRECRTNGSVRGALSNKRPYPVQVAARHGKRRSPRRGRSQPAGQSVVPRNQRRLQTVERQAAHLSDAYRCVTTVHWYTQARADLTSENGNISTEASHEL